MPQPRKPRVLSWDDIDQADDLPVEDVDCPEWGGVVKVRALTRQRVVETLQEVTDPDGMIDQPRLQMLLVVRGMHEPQITEDRMAQLERKHPAPLKRISDTVARISAMTPDAVEGAEARFPDDA